MGAEGEEGRLGYRGPNVNFPENVHPEKPEGIAPGQTREARRKGRPIPSGRLGDILVRVALALPMAYLVYHLWEFRGPSYHVNGVRFAEALVLPALGLLVGCVLVLSGRRTRWPWLIVAAGSLWLPFGLNWLLFGRLGYPWPWHPGWPPPVPLLWPYRYQDFLLGYAVPGVYALLLALGMLFGAQTRSPHVLPSSAEVTPGAPF